MDDKAIIDLYWQRCQQAVAETAAKYGALCLCIARNILSSREDAEESVNDTYLAAWNTMPPQRPAHLCAYLGKLTRYISLDKWKQRSRLKRGGGEVPLCLEELSEVVSGKESPENGLIRKEALAAVNRFLGTLPETERQVFLRRYWYAEPIADIAARFGFTESKTVSMLHRTRIKLRKQLAKEEIA